MNTPLHPGSGLACVAAWLLAVLACAWLTGSEARGQRIAAVVVALIGAMTPLALPSSAILGRSVLTAAGILLVFRTFDLLRSPKLGPAVRLWLLLGVFDVRRSNRTTPAVDPSEARWLLGHLGIAGTMAFGVLRVAPAFDGPLFWASRWGFGVGFCYALVEVLHSALLLGYQRAGFSVPRINDFPIRSTTLAEFWGRRWNRVVAGWLRDYLFFPVARRGSPSLAIVVAFAGSMALHFWLAWVPLGAPLAALMASFFVVQGAALLLERRLGVHAWPQPRRRGWTIAWLLLSSPLFVEPALRIYLGPP